MNNYALPQNSPIAGEGKDGENSLPKISSRISSLEIEFNSIWLVKCRVDNAKNNCYEPINLAHC